ncbi:hypothetical protein [Actinomadura opuntiae]|uniref:hypothetical protein n=1 Tax=Actinomadura sp. OS1-43 TaxID=604315 RepID=UPI00255AD485|nr:hypothetical protein [Actinomadura sp. OS1-43]MDL4814035.1 hypothetical protein [Actinomadura sp. OS1-43]
MTASTLIAPSAADPSPVRLLWGTSVLVGNVDLDGIVRPDLTAMDPPGTTGGAACREIPADEALNDPRRLAALFAEAMDAAADRKRTAGDVDLTVQVWEAGHGVPAEARPATWAGWCYLAATPAPAARESGCLALADPRPASDQTAVPGLPWGRAILARPSRGVMVVAPGWLTTSVVPVENGQRLIVAIAASAR